jgi:hypothetical protein
MLGNFCPVKSVKFAGWKKFAERLPALRVLSYYIYWFIMIGMDVAYIVSGLGRFDRIS